MTKVDLHIVSFDVPYPADYGGVIDVFYRLKSLHELGLKVAIHLYDYGRGKQEALENYAEEVHYYSRSQSVLKQLSKLPFIVNSRDSKDLLKRLNADRAPILFEGIHTTFFLCHPSLANRLKIVRTHNVEHEYYYALSKAHKGWKKFYFQWEARRLKHYEKVLNYATHILAISQSDQLHFRKYKAIVHLVFPFHPFEYQEHKLKEEHFALYHGNLSVRENQKAVEFLLQVFTDLDRKLLIAGKNPPQAFVQKLKQYQHIQLIPNPEEQQLKRLIQTAKVNCLPTFQATGVKLKLIRALIEGNDVIVNDQMLNGTDLGNYCEIANSVEEWKVKLEELFTQKKDIDKRQSRQKKVAAMFDNKKSAMLVKELFAQAR